MTDLSHGGFSSEGVGLDQITHLLGAIEQRLAELRHVASNAARRGAFVDPGSALETARRLYVDRRARDEVFKGLDIFGEPAWDILLDLFIAWEIGRKIAVSSACIAAAAPGTTALRYIETLTARGLIERHPDPDDRRRIWLRLSKRGYEMMLAALRQKS